jgi:triosephosphate isomerase
MEKQKIIIGNWKMSPKTPEEAKTIFQDIKKTAGKLSHVKTVICAPYIYQTELKKLAKGEKFTVGSQDVSIETEDAHTGEISAEMLKNIGMEYVIIGHSERRAKGETSADLLKKITEVIKKDMTVILCVGEKERDEHGEYTKLIRAQILEVLQDFQKKNVGKLILAYEPVWAIGKNAQREATKEDVQETTIFIRKVLRDLFDEKTAARIPLLYGGSVNQKNCAEYLIECGMDGLLVGRVSLQPEAFSKILTLANDIFKK